MKRKTENDAAIERARALIQSCKNDGGYFVPSLDVFKLETRRVAFDLASVARSLLASTTSAKRQRFLKYIARRAERIARGPVNEKRFLFLIGSQGKRPRFVPK